MSVRGAARGNERGKHVIIELAEKLGECGRQEE